MNVADYRRYHLDLQGGVLAGNPTHFQLTETSEIDIKRYDNYRRGLIVLALVSFIESNFIQNDIKNLRKFQPITSINPLVNQTHLSCYIYMRDCFAHNPLSILLPTGNNTASFVNAVHTGYFPYASILGQSIFIKETHPLHLIVLRLYGENV